MFLIVTLSFLAVLIAIFIFQVLIRPIGVIRRSGFSMKLIEFYQNQANGFPMFRLLYLSGEFKKEHIVIQWEDIAWFHRSALMEISNRSEFHGKSTPELLADVLEAISLVKSEGYVMSFQQAVMQILKGKNSREVAADFIHLMWQAEGRTH